MPPSASSPYSGAQRTGSIRASLQRALDNYKTGHINLAPPVNSSDLSRSDTLSFGESHASELSSISTTPTLEAAASHGMPQPHPAVVAPTAAVAPTAGVSLKDNGPIAAQHKSTSAASPALASPPINPTNLNLAPAPIPALNSAPTQTTPPLTSNSTPPALDTTNSATALPPITPTVAETGVPVSAGPSGPGPSHGSLRDVRGTGTTSHDAPLSFGASGTAVVSTPQWNSAEDEKKRLAAAYSQAYDAPAGPPPTTTTQAQTPHYESAEDEKRRLEREEREKLQKKGGDVPPSDTKPGKDEDLPPYQDL